MSHALLDEILQPGGILAGALPGYEQRPQQLKMAHAVLSTLEEGGTLLVEAGTGTGKTLAYLIPAILSGKKVVVSTGTRNLQEQIFEKDIPLLRRHLDMPFDAALLKGISNYACARRLAEVGDTQDADLIKILRWAKHTEAGDRAGLGEVAEESPAWKLVTATPDSRLGPKCPFYERCFVTQARRRASRAQLVIVNHHLFFADLALRSAYEGAQVLPSYDAVVFDEAHQLEEVATEHFTISVSTLRLGALLRDARKALVDLPGTPTQNARAASGLLANLEARCDELFHAVRARLCQAGPNLLLPPDAAGTEKRAEAPEDLFAGTRRDLWFKVDAALEELSAHAGQRAAGSDGETAHGVARRADAVRADLATLAEQNDTKRHVYWTELSGRSLFLHASPVDVAPVLRQRVVESLEASVFTSATLTTGGRFDYVRARLGIPSDIAVELTLDSPFDFSRQSLLYLPRDLPSPKEPEFAAAALSRITELLQVTQGRAMVLFTSHKSLRQAASELRQRVPFPVLVQGELTRPTLLETFRKQVGSVLLATSSFWEGVDVPGEALSLVILEKLPFAVPDDPLTSARVRRLEDQGLDPFFGYQVPRAALSLKQGFGRLIRTRRDRGIVAILDHRILTKGYGRVFLQSLPPAGRTSVLEQVRRWWLG
ncbi:MAG: ATP-dependent DNA helicase [Deltaproteobacteria bacterium]|nr:ATP-dependent DNA helicase [Deltaproteobacteria bacterium]